MQAERATFLEKHGVTLLQGTEENLLDMIEFTLSDLQDGRFQPINPPAHRAIPNAEGMAGDFRRRIYLENFPGLEIIAKDGHACGLVIHAPSFKAGTLRLLNRFAMSGYDTLVEPESWNSRPGVMAFATNPYELALTETPERFQIKP